MCSKVTLYGLTPNDFMHPKEKEMHLPGSQFQNMNGLIDKLTDLSVILSKQIVLGKYVEATKQTHPRVFDILEDVCRVLGCKYAPRLYLTHEYDASSLQVGSETLCILLPDLLVERADDDMLRFVLGNTVGMHMGGHIRLATINSVLCAIKEALPFRLALQEIQRRADLSSDRAGLLACQNISAAIRGVLWDMGMPPEELFALSDEETMELARDYNRELNYIHSSSLGEAATAFNRWMGTSSPGNYRISELCAWYEDGYPQLMSRLAH